MSEFVRPIRRHVLLVDDQPGPLEENGVLVKRLDWACAHLDYVVARVGAEEDVEFGQGDTVILGKADAGRRVMIDGVLYRLVRVSDIIAYKEN